MNELGARVRLVKGAYREPAAVALQQKREVDEAFERFMRLLLDGGTYPAIATHDEKPCWQRPARMRQNAD